jgi:hypothetical protein
MQRMKVYKGMFRPWNPMKAKIKVWLKTKELEFAQKDNRNPKLTPHKYLDKYVFSDLHEVFFCDFPHLLQEVQGTEGRTPIQFTIGVEPTTPCVTNTLERTPAFRQPNFSGRNIVGNTSKQGVETRGASSGTNSKISTPREGSSSTQFKMVGHNPIIRLPEF